MIETIIEMTVNKRYYVCLTRKIDGGPLICFHITFLRNEIPLITLLFCLSNNFFYLSYPECKEFTVFQSYRKINICICQRDKSQS